MRQFSDQHLAALAILVLVGGLAVWGARHHPGRWEKPFSAGLACVIFSAWAGEYVADAVLGIWSVKYTLPLQLTDAVSAASILALLTRRRLLVELAYFWAFTATLQAVLTPDLGYSFPSVFYFTYFGYHVGAIVAALFLVFGCRLYPRPRAIWWVYAATVALAAVAGLGDLLSGGNYMYLRSKPVHSSLFNVFGPWPWYIATTAAVGLLMLIVVQLITDRIHAAIDPRVLS